MGPSRRKVEIPCPSCGKTHLFAEEQLPASGEFPCPDCGGTIAFASPTAPPPPPARVATGGERMIRVEDWEEDDQDPWTEVACPACGHRFDPRQARAGVPTVLVVEDTDFFLKLATDALGQRFNTVGARSVAEARQALATRPIDLVVLDLTLPDGDGTDVLRALPRQDIPVLVYTSRDETSLLGEEWNQLRALGVNDAVYKGIHIEDALMTKAANLLRQDVPEPIE